MHARARHGSWLVPSGKEREGRESGKKRQKTIFYTASISTGRRKLSIEKVGLIYSRDANWVKKIPSPLVCLFFKWVIKNLYKIVAEIKKYAPFQMLFLHNICLQIEVDVYVHNEFF